jgi:hypothetical protein
VTEPRAAGIDPARRSRHASRVEGTHARDGRSDARDRAAELLEQAGARDRAHPSGTLLAHLEGTRACLERWGCRPALCAAGLYHSVYGTEAYPTPTVMVADRARVRERIGDEAEALAHLYCVMSRASLYENLDRRPPHHVVERSTGRRIALDGNQLPDLLVLDLANRLEQLPRTPPSLRRMEADRRRYEQAVPILPPLAVAELRAAYPPRARSAVVLDTLVRGLCRLRRTGQRVRR